MNTAKVQKHIVNWLYDYSKTSKTKGFVIGISGGIDSAVTSTLAAKTGLPLLCLEMPIHQNKNQLDNAKKHIDWLKKNYKNVANTTVDLSAIFDLFSATVAHSDNKELTFLSLANTRARLRMTTLYHYAQTNGYLVLGTGNKIEDFGVGFYTKYGDGGVDLSPIADLMKTQSLRYIAMPMIMTFRTSRLLPCRHSCPQMSAKFLINSLTKGLYGTVTLCPRQGGTDCLKKSWPLSVLRRVPMAIKLPPIAGFKLQKPVVARSSFHQTRNREMIDA